MRNQSARFESATLALTLVTCGLLFAATFTPAPHSVTVLAMLGFVLSVAILVGQFCMGVINHDV